jgi:uncharacterized protein YdhG (YjbR/CyaY superfamily)
MVSAMPKTTSASAKRKQSGVFSSDELAAMKEYVAETKAARRKGGQPDGEADVLAKIAEMDGADKAIAERIHAIVKASAPHLSPKTWYGMPAYARGEKVVCFVQPAAKFKARYVTLGFSDLAKLDEGSMWPSSYAITKLTKADEVRIAALVKQAAE